MGSQALDGWGFEAGVPTNTISGSWARLHSHVHCSTMMACESHLLVVSFAVEYDYTPYGVCWLQ
jgi:hypothetical protein